MFFVSRGFSLVHSGDRDSASDSPVSELLSTLIKRGHTQLVFIRTSLVRVIETSTVGNARISVLLCNHMPGNEATIIVALFPCSPLLTRKVIRMTFDLQERKVSGLYCLLFLRVKGCIYVCITCA